MLLITDIWEPAVNMAVEYVDVPDSEGKQLVVLHADITQNEMSAKLNITVRAVANRLKPMIERGVIKRVGPDNGGHWELIIPQQ